jgi:hypothetical protein
MRRAAPLLRAASAWCVPPGCGSEDVAMDIPSTQTLHFEGAAIGNLRISLFYAESDSAPGIRQSCRPRGHRRMRIRAAGGLG